MKPVQRLLFFTTILFQTFSSFAQSNIDVLHYKFEIELNDKNDSIYGKADIKVIVNENITSATFDLSGLGANGKGMVVETAVTNWKTQKPITWKHENNKLTIYDAHGKGDSVTFTISYKGIPADGLIISKISMATEHFLEITGLTGHTTGYPAKTNLAIRPVLNFSLLLPHSTRLFQMED
jgi:hypothetical protein